MIVALRSPKASLLKAALLAGAVALAPIVALAQPVATQPDTPQGAAGAANAAPSSSAAASSAPETGDASGMPPIALSSNALEAASAFRAYEKKAASISPAFTSGGGVEESLAIGAAYEPKQLSRGEIAYAALVALQDPTFVSAVRVYAKDPGQRRDLAARLVQDPRYAIAFPGASNAAGLIVATLAADSGRLHAAGAAVKQSAYSVQHSSWSKSRVIDPAGRLARAKSLSAAIMASTPDDVTLLRAAEGAGGEGSPATTLGVHGQPVAGPYEPVVTRGLAVAALAVLGQAGDDNDAAVETVLNEPENGACLNMSKLNLYQCLAVAGPWYEDIFCLGEHAMMETAQCLTKEMGTATQIQAAVTPASPAATALATPVTATAANLSAVAPTAMALGH